MIATREGVTFEQEDKVSFVNAINIMVPDATVVEEFDDSEGVRRVKVKYLLNGKFWHAYPTKDRVGYTYKGA